MNKRLKKKLFGALVRNARSLGYKIGAIFPPTLTIASDDTIIDVAIPCVSKDFDILPLCIEGILNNVVNPVNHIYVITPDVDKLDKSLICKYNGIKFIDEREIMGFGASELKDLLPECKFNRAGWIYQQLLKLSGRIGYEENILFIDSDHILIRPHVFIDKNGCVVFYRSEEAYYPYYENIHRLMGRFPISRFSYVAHKMIFNKTALHRIRENLGGETIGCSGFAKWIEVICKSLDWNLTDMPFSEFELYGNEFPNNKKRFILWRQKTLSTLHSKMTYPDIVNMYGKKYLSVTFPAYLKSKE